jgi:hypothetical protein
VGSRGVGEDKYKFYNKKNNNFKNKNNNLKIKIYIKK